MSKRKLEQMIQSEGEGQFEDYSNKKQDIPVNKHSLDSDEEDSADEDYDRMNSNEIEGEEDGEMFKEGEVHITPFNMKEEMQEGHFDNQGHYHWKKNDEKDIKDHWLDNIDWVKIKDTKDEVTKDNDESDTEEPFDPTESFKKMLELMKPNETVLKALQRLGKSSKISSAQRWKNKKSGIVDPNVELVTSLTSLANEILTRTGDMDIYQQTFESITKQIETTLNKKPTSTSELDMYADDFDEKEKEKITTGESSKSAHLDDTALMWEFKWGTKESDEVHGPHTTEQMQEWVQSGYFKTGVWVRKVGQEGDFHTSNRIDFELYL